jgi:hypothetical protein
MTAKAPAFRVARTVVARIVVEMDRGEDDAGVPLRIASSMSGERARRPRPLRQVWQGGAYQRPAITTERWTRIVFVIAVALVAAGSCALWWSEAAVRYGAPRGDCIDDSDRMPFGEGGGRRPAEGRCIIPFPPLRKG